MVHYTSGLSCCLIESLSDAILREILLCLLSHILECFLPLLGVCAVFDAYSIEIDIKVDNVALLICPNGERGDIAETIARSAKRLGVG